MDFEWLPDTLGTEAVLLVCSFVLSGIIGLERELRQKSAGTRTHILVGMGSALFTLVSSYGFGHVIGDDVILDPSRIAAQIVTGIGFLGAGVIFVRRNIVSGLTTAASVWVTAAVGMACGAGMPVIAALTVVLYIFAVTLLTALIRRIPTQHRTEVYSVRYADGYGVLRDVLHVASESGYEVSLNQTKRERTEAGHVVDATMEFTHGKQKPPESLFRQLSEVEGVLEVRAEDQDHD
ncbi:MgtC/SapB family protein [Yaniella flava]|uniref:MgtC/SapB family protein n=1 Tax=Yaniella flava TaxID=287930 RepID=A0ABN2U042_9MICC